MAAGLPRFILIKYYDMLHTVFAYADEHEGIPGSVVLEGDQGMYNPLAKIEIEPAKVDSKYVHLRFCYANKYLARRDAKDGFVVADSDKPDEDRSKASCTLFEPVKADDDGNMYLIHVHTGWHAQYDGGMRMCVVQENGIWEKFRFVDWNTIVKLPEHVAFKGDNGKYLQAVTIKNHPFLQFSSDDPYDKRSGFRVEHRPDGYVRIKSDHTGKYWRLSPAWIWADKSDDYFDFERLEDAFWPVKNVDDGTIALRNGANGRYCKRLTDEHKKNCLNAAVENTTKEARMVVEELVQERKIYGVIYRLENARISDEKPYVGGTTTLYNKGDEETSMDVELESKDEKSTSFNRSISQSFGVTTTIEASVPEILDFSVQLSYDITGTLEWGTTTTKTITIKVKGAVRVPARSMVVVNYVGTMGTCNVPFSYTQEDRSSTDDKIVYSTQNDGIYTGVNCYNFQFVVDKAHPI